MSTKNARPATADRILRYPEIIADLGCSPSEFYRRHRPKLAVVELGERGGGIRESEYLRYKSSLIERSLSPHGYAPQRAHNDQATARASRARRPSPSARISATPSPADIRSPSLEDAEYVAEALGDAEREGSSWRCRCPVHDGRS